MRILILLMFLNAMLLVGCNSQQTSNMASPAASYMQEGDEDKDCAALKNEMSQLAKDIHNESEEADKKKSSNFLLGAAGCFSIVPWFYMDMDAIENAKTEVVALQERYNALFLIAYNKGCIVKQASSKISGKTDTDKLPLVCKYCGPTDSEKWRIVYGQLMCNACYKKEHASK